MLSRAHSVSGRASVRQCRRAGLGRRQYRGRHPQYPEVPTFEESGVKGFEFETWFALTAPAGVPKDIVRRMSAETAKALNSPDIKAKFEALGIITGDTSPEFAAKFLDDEIVKWAKVISTAGVKAE